MRGGGFFLGILKQLEFATHTHVHSRHDKLRQETLFVDCLHFFFFCGLGRRGGSGSGEDREISYAYCTGSYEFL